MRSTKRRTSQYLKQFFTFNKSERKGVYLLVCAIVVATILPLIYKQYFVPALLPINHSQLPVIMANNSEPLQYPAFPNPTDEAQLFNSSFSAFSFNPNTADSATLLQLGFAPRVIKGMLNFRNKGGKFRKPEDLFKLYHIDSTHVQQLLPYVQLDTEESKYPKSTQMYTKPEPQVVEINTADSVTLVKLYGIGPRMASKIITYRSEVGGFFTVNQLAEIWGFDPLLIDELKGKITADATQVRYLHINQVSYEELKKHPYLRFKQAAAIVNYRKQHGAFTTANELKNVIIIPDSTIRKLEPYLRFD